MTDPVNDFQGVGYKDSELDKHGLPIKPMSLEDRILSMVADLPQWDFKTVKAYLPNVHEKSLYRAIAKLVEQGKVTKIGWQGNSKRYTTLGVSKLPTLKLQNGQSYDIKVLFPTIAEGYRNGWHSSAEIINELPLTINTMFMIAQMDDDKEMMEAYKDLILKLSKYKDVLTVLLSWINSIQSHEVMSGDLRLFKKTLTGDSPTNDQMAAFKSWLARFRRGEFN